jgi:hypothetical protein
MATKKTMKALIGGALRGNKKSQNTVLRKRTDMILTPTKSKSAYAQPKKAKASLAGEAQRLSKRRKALKGMRGK